MDECRYIKGLWNMEQPKNMEEKGLERASPLTILKYSETSSCYIKEILNYEIIYYANEKLDLHGYVC